MKVMSEVYIRSPFFEKPRKMHRCNICLYTTSKTTNLRRHLLIHSREKPFQCDVCSKSFTQKQTLHRHICRVPNVFEI
ncbi:UNVERIFIED_CONTAM: Ras-responsive element-binding protein 1 [Trichonephila clavipes]